MSMRTKVRMVSFVTKPGRRLVLNRGERVDHGSGAGGGNGGPNRGDGRRVQADGCFDDSNSLTQMSCFTMYD